MKRIWRAIRYGRCDTEGEGSNGGSHKRHYIRNKAVGGGETTGLFQMAIDGYMLELVSTSCHGRTTLKNSQGMKEERRGKAGITHVRPLSNLMSQPISARRRMWLLKMGVIS